MYDRIEHILEEYIQSMVRAMNKPQIKIGGKDFIWLSCSKWAGEEMRRRIRSKPKKMARQTVCEFKNEMSALTNNSSEYHSYLYSTAHDAAEFILDEASLRRRE